MSAEKIRSLGWKPAIRLEGGIAATYAALLDRNDVIAA